MTCKQHVTQCYASAYLVQQSLTYSRYNYCAVLKVSTSGILRTKNYFLFYFIKGWKGFWENPIWTQKTSITKKKKIIIILIYHNLMEQVLTRSPLAGKASCLILSSCELFLSNDSPPCVWNIGFGADILAVSCVCFPIL